MRLMTGDRYTLYENQDVFPRAYVAHATIAAVDGETALAALESPTFDPRRTVVLEGTSAADSQAETRPERKRSGRHTSRATTPRRSPSRPMILCPAGWS